MSDEKKGDEILNKNQLTKEVDSSIHEEKNTDSKDSQKNADREKLINRLIAKQVICQGRMCGTFRDGIEVFLEGVGEVRIARTHLGNNGPVSQLERVFMDRDIRYIITEHRTNSKIVHGSSRLIAEIEKERIDPLAEDQIKTGNVVKGVVEYIDLKSVSVNIDNHLCRVENNKLLNPQKISVGDVLLLVIESVANWSDKPWVCAAREIQADITSPEEEQFSMSTGIKSKTTQDESKTNDSASLLRIQFVQHAALALQVVNATKGLGVKAVLNGTELLMASTLFFLGEIMSAEDEISDSELSFIGEILGTKITLQNISDIMQQKDLKELLFHYASLSDSLIKIHSITAEKSVFAAFFDFFRQIGTEYLKLYGTANKVDKYNHHMNDILSQHKKNGSNEQLQFQPFIQNEKEIRFHNQVMGDVGNTHEYKTQDKLQEALAELNSLIGLESIKQDVAELIGLVKTMRMREARGLPSIPVSLHLVFTGNPGTGKTTVARILGQLYKEIGVLKKGQMIEVDRSELVAGYVGQTAIKTQEKIKEANGGILFIDEAYTLVKEGNDFGQEAIDTILKEMEDHRGEFVVIVAGYAEPMRRFIDSNPGLKSRFNKYFEFPDYSDEELIEIFESMCSKYNYRTTDEARLIINEKIKEMEQNKGENFANARDVRNLFERIITKQANRVAVLTNVNDNDLSTIVVEDVQ